MTGSVAVDLLAKTHFPFTLWSNMILPSVLGVKDAHSLDAEAEGKTLHGQFVREHFRFRLQLRSRATRVEISIIVVSFYWWIVADVPFTEDQILYFHHATSWCARTNTLLSRRDRDPEISLLSTPLFHNMHGIVSTKNSYSWFDGLSAESQTGSQSRVYISINHAVSGKPETTYQVQQLEISLVETCQISPRSFAVIGHIQHETILRQSAYPCFLRHLGYLLNPKPCYVPQRRKPFVFPRRKQKPPRGEAATYIYMNQSEDYPLNKKKTCDIRTSVSRRPA